ncbi:CRE-GRL-11 protein [Caenorhabditis remanei]|uniref:CRE-GRL-11 protein n=1 Tax=Caenorhabditis remanei TaxID=31234 RepID=E3LSM8_CAERE|nr:CRE-GRL-11 protein [Caenorhabditis remanei]
MGHCHHILLLIIGLRVTIEVRGNTTIEGNTNNSSRVRDYIDPPYASSLIQNPNVRTKPLVRPRKDDDCSDEILRKVMNEVRLSVSSTLEYSYFQHISDEGMTESKRAIHAAARRDFEGTWSVICAPCAFSYLAHAQEFCIHSRHGITCLLYRDE